MTMDKKTELFVIDDTKVLSDLTRKIDEEPGDSAKDLRVTLQDKVPISEWCDDLNKVLLRQPLVQCVNFSANLVTREIVHGMGKRSTIQNVMPGICFELILMIREGKSSGVNRLVRQKQELRLMANDETHVFDEMSARVDFCLNREKKITDNCTRLQGFSIFNVMGGGIGSGLGLVLQNMWGVLQSYNFVQSKLFDPGIFFNNVHILIECRIKRKSMSLNGLLRVDTFEGMVHKNTSNERLICNVNWRRLVRPSLVLLDSSRKNEKKLVVKGNESRDKLIQYHKKRAIGEDFRDEFFYTNRYLCEITGLNVENEIKRYYSEGMDITDKRCQMIFGAVGEQYPFETLEHK
ncbi:hypothetical protein V6N11_072780 [Hibiscus sabdariffa]|uniref:Uncharacterized protein n=1 Tax=Hibiscus sabdariffa TaxID=183260 RepID=A0ABR2NEL8_9ROSI